MGDWSMLYTNPPTVVMLYLAFSDFKSHTMICRSMEIVQSELKSAPEHRALNTMRVWLFAFFEALNCCQRLPLDLLMSSKYKAPLKAQERVNNRKR